MSFKSSIYVCLSILIFVASCFFPAVTFKIASDVFSDSSPVDVKWGYAMLLYGPFGIMIGSIASIPWFANGFYIISIWSLISNKSQQAFQVSLLAFVFGLLFPILSFISPIPQDEGGVMHARIYRVHIGYLLWMMSMPLILLISNYEQRKESDNSTLVDSTK